MNNSDRNAAKSMVFYIIVFLFVFITLIISVLLLGVLSSERLKIVLIITLTIESLGFITLLFFLFKLFKSIDVINSQAGQIAQGNLRIDDMMEQETFGLGILTNVFNDMKSNLLRFIALTKVNIISISDAIENVSKSINSSYLGNEQIAANMEDVAEKSKEQAGLMGDTMSKINEMKTRIEIITQSVEQVEKSVEESAHATASGVKNLDEYYNQVNIISDNLNNTSEYIKKLNEDINKIDEIGKFIRKTSEQLKLLGLNASVEAARAGEAGKGFAVVAHEMNLLSTATKESIGKIGGILKSIQTRSEYVNAGIDNCVESYDISKDIFKSIKRSFEIINDNANMLESDIKKVGDEVQLINSSIHEINKESEELYNISENISKKTIEVSAVTQTELDELQNINNNTSNLKIMLRNVERLAGRFSISIVPVKEKAKKQLRIVFISPLDNEFWHVIRKGVLYAKRELSEKNVIIDYYGFEENVGDQIKETVKEAIQNGVDGIIVPGFDRELANLIV
jgi:methyl-accepting chemotaxis protein